MEGLQVQESEELIELCSDAEFEQWQQKSEAEWAEIWAEFDALVSDRPYLSE